LQIVPTDVQWDFIPQREGTADDLLMAWILLSREQRTVPRSMCVADITEGDGIHAINNLGQYRQNSIGQEIHDSSKR
jgi:autonomous glycyl radical cofactor GrcA